MLAKFTERILFSAPSIVSLALPSIVIALLLAFPISLITKTAPLPAVDAAGNVSVIGALLLFAFINLFVPVNVASALLDSTVRPPPDCATQDSPPDPSL
jgi:flagellar biosynthesis protein FliR